MFRNVKALMLNDLGTWRRGGNHTTTISETVESQNDFCFIKKQLEMQIDLYEDE